MQLQARLDKWKDGEETLMKHHKITEALTDMVNYLRIWSIRQRNFTPTIDSVCDFSDQNSFTARFVGGDSASIFSTNWCLSWCTKEMIVKFSTPFSTFVVSQLINPIMSLIFVINVHLCHLFSFQFVIMQLLCLALTATTIFVHQLSCILYIVIFPHSNSHLPWSICPLLRSSTAHLTFHGL